MAMEQSEGRANVYLFSGAEEWLKREALDKLRAKWLVSGLEALNETVLEGATAQQIIDAIRENGGGVVLSDAVIGRAVRRYNSRQAVITGGAGY